MKRIKTFGTLLLLIVAATSFMPGCKDKPTDPKPASNTLFDSLVGTWDWVMKEGGIAWRVYTPDSVGYHVTLEITKDSFWIFNSSEPMEKKKYKFRLTKDKQCEMFTDHDVEALLYDSTGTSLMDTAPISLHKDSLSFSECAADGFFFKYVKKK